ncbi:hypothetical protein QYE76_033025 [Lolium multiflorum]|uniref:Uncharacterized protein n=1 Tax=Lolium multiflorum TaxID=4521 RepID=A0AAD8QVB5_LOLMU|nr:hypothetical protein QYE76_033025 [Lolium multiflorum]
MSSKFRSSAVKYAEKKRRLEISRDASRNQVGSPSPPPPPKRVRAVLTGLVSFAMYFRFFFPGSSSSNVFKIQVVGGQEAAPTIDTTVAILMEKNEELSLECDRLRDDLAAKKKNSKTLVELICSLRNERDMLKNELIKQKERNIASEEEASSILKTVCLGRDKSDIEYKILLQDKVELQKMNLEYADIAILALLDKQKAQDKLMHLMLESCSEREETLKEMSSLVRYMSDVGRTSQNPPRLSSNSSGTSFQQCMLCAPTTSTH